MSNFEKNRFKPLHNGMDEAAEDNQSVLRYILTLRQKIVMMKLLNLTHKNIKIIIQKSDGDSEDYMSENWLI